jgi:hypothetical protein
MEATPFEDCQDWHDPVTDCARVKWSSEGLQSGVGMEDQVDVFPYSRHRDKKCREKAGWEWAAREVLSQDCYYPGIDDTRAFF